MSETGVNRTADDLALLFPDRTLTIAGESVRVSEFRYLQGLEALALARSFLTELRELMTGAAADFTPEALFALVGRHRTMWIELVALACARPVAWIAALPDREAVQIDLAFWEVNGPFFTRRLLFGAALLQVMREQSSPPPNSSPISSGPDTDATSTRSGSGSHGVN